MRLIKIQFRSYFFEILAIEKFSWNILRSLAIFPKNNILI